MVERLMNSEENTKRIKRVENAFGTFGTPLLTPGRVLVGEGILTKMCRKKSKLRQVFLFNDILVYGTLITKKKFGPQKIIPLEQIEIEDIEDSNDMKNGWLIKTPSKSFAVYSSTLTEKHEWMDHIRKCIEYRVAHTGRRPSLSSYAPTWIPDTEVSTCMICKKTQFGVITRKHHCRKCGRIVCNTCSSRRFLLPHQSNKPVRVCDPCFVSLSETPSSPTASSPDASKDEEFVDSDDGIINEINKELDASDISRAPTFYSDSNGMPPSNQ
ncbi:Pleckstrin-likey domain-containing family F member 2, partial [Fragariocoptes setiger]